MQGITDLLSSMGFLILLVGVVLIIIGIVSFVQSESSDDESRDIQNKGIVVIGCIPIVWGVGRKYQVALIAIGILLLLIWLWT
ncbi:MAG: DUF131 domain-containing protein [Candidatus Thorarchaeota archaeon]